ncbi:MAG: glutathione S-transferase family protein [Proteobacteria bacterium]|nr:glutathione S-transferase family protein [Pseudomonadota bacterium]
MSYTLIIGNKNYSSWSLRPWLVLRAAGIAFDETLIALHSEEFDAEIRSRKRSPNGRVPVLIDGATTVWDSLAICEYLAERHAGLWPDAAAARAHARCACAEMHSGFGAMRQWLPMNVRRRYPLAALRSDVAADVGRVQSLWAEARERFGAGGPYLYGAFSIADAYFAPVVFRFQTYGVAASAIGAQYMATMLAHPAMQQWAADAQAERMVVADEEPETLYGAR